jgi:CRP-like cAMP-binding protein
MLSGWIDPPERSGDIMPAAVIRETPVDARLLRSLFLFEALPTQELETLEANTVLADYDAGIVFAEGDPARYFFVLVEGELAVSKRVGDRDVETSRTTHQGIYCGATAAFIEMHPKNTLCRCGPRGRRDWCV